MCDILSVGSAVLSGASIAANTIASQQQERKRNEVMQAERARQAEYQAQANDLARQSLSRYDGVATQQPQRASELAQFFQQAPAQGAATMAIAPSDSAITVREEGAQAAKAGAYNNARAATLGNLRSFGDLLGAAGRGQARDSALAGQLGGFARGSSAQTAYELEDARSAGSGMRTLADLLQVGGSIGISKGLQGGFAPTQAAGAPLTLTSAAR
jgi:hypothetical protein